MPPIGRMPVGAIVSRPSASNRNSLMTDFLVVDHGSIVSIQPLSAAARELLDANIVTEPWQWMDGAFIEHRCARDILTPA